MSGQWLRAGLGLVLVLVSVTAVLSAREGLRFVGDARAPDHRLDVVGTVADEVRNGTTEETVYRISVRHPSEMRINESRTVELTFDAALRDGDREIPLGRLGAEVEATASLSATSFEIAPGSTIERRRIPPLALRWTIAPTTEGAHELILDASDLLGPDVPRPDRRTVLVNGREATGFDAELIPLRVRVFTPWGISRNLFHGLQGALGLVGFILMYPLWIEGMRRAMGWHENQPAPELPPEPGAENHEGD